MDYKQIQMDLDEIFSDKLSVTCNLASGLSVFKTFTKSSDAVIRHFQRKDKDILIYTFNYLGRKIHEPYDKDVEHPNDTGIAILLLYFIEHDEKLYRLSSLYLMKHIKHLFWTKKVMQEVGTSKASDLVKLND